MIAGWTSLSYFILRTKRPFVTRVIPKYPDAVSKEAQDRPCIRRRSGKKSAAGGNRGADRLANSGRKGTAERGRLPTARRPLDGLGWNPDRRGLADRRDRRTGAAPSRAPGGVQALSRVVVDLVEATIEGGGTLSSWSVPTASIRPPLSSTIRSATWIEARLWEIRKVVRSLGEFLDRLADQQLRPGCRRRWWPRRGSGWPGRGAWRGPGRSAAAGRRRARARARR